MSDASACVLFADPCRENHLDFLNAENKIFFKNLDIPPCHECLQDIYLGFFFDGTNNNKFRDTQGYGHSNVARLTWAMLQVCNQIHAALTELYDQLYRQLDRLEAALALAIQQRNRNKPTLRRIRLTIMSFSRGAADGDSRKLSQIPPPIRRPRKGRQ